MGGGLLASGYGDGTRCRSLLPALEESAGLSSWGTKATRWGELPEAYDWAPGDIASTTLTSGIFPMVVLLCFLLPELSCLFKFGAALDGSLGLQLCTVCGDNPLVCLSSVFGLQPIVSFAGGGTTRGVLNPLNRLLTAPVKVFALPLDGLSMLGSRTKHKELLDGDMKV